MDDRSRRTLSVVIAGGGTGGHLYPGIAVATEFMRRRPDARITFAGTAAGLEARIVPQEGFTLDLIKSAGLKGKSWRARATAGLLIAPSLRDAWLLIGRRRPDVVIGVGGFSSGPVVLAAVLRGIPTMVLEQNAVPGLTNRLLARLVRAAAVTYEETLPFFGQRGFVSGNPVRAEFFAPASNGGQEVREARHVLILGGSQGAHAVNVIVVGGSARLLARHPNVQMVHQTGARDLAEVREGYARAGVPARAEAFFDRVATELVAADLVVCRAGATTLAELAATGRPAILVPLPTATDDHQRKNARVLADAGGALVVEQTIGGDGLADTIAALLDAPDRLQAMGLAMKSLAKPDAARRIVDRALELVR
ncbi:MAG: undecaprenyldiphospho-muramoylpentapeptide beta-N-acetylglucosaminyltransferase [Vicinamibacterales bacterium]